VKFGIELLVVGALHLISLLVFSRVRRNGLLLESLRRPASVASSASAVTSASPASVAE
jgi:hypothetical protein